MHHETRAGHDITLDVHPANYARLLYGDEPVLLGEGIKKGDCATSLGLLAVSLSGVWNWGKKRKRGGAKYGRPELPEDWDAIPLEGRTFYICFDADYREKPNVALAMLRCGERLTERGARVYVVNLPGPEKGLDDYVVAGGDLNALLRDARPFTPSDLIPYAAKQDKRIWAVVERIGAAMRIDGWTQAGANTTRGLLRTFLELALLGGRYDKDEDGVEVMMGTRELCNYAAIGSRHTLGRHTAKLEERGYVTKVTGDRKNGKANRYVLKLSKSAPVIERGNEVSISSIRGALLDNFAPHLRWPSPASRAPADEDRDSKLPKPEARPVNAEDKRPNLSGLYHGDEVRGVAEERETEVALGKTVEMALDLLLSWGGEVTLRDLATATDVNHTAKMRYRLEAVEGVFDLDPKGKHGARVRLTDHWRRRLDERRERSGELRRFRQQAVKNRTSREEFRKSKEGKEPPASADQETNLMGRERAGEVIKRAEGRDHEARIEEQRRKVGMTPEVFLADTLGSVTGFGWRELRALWIAKGGDREDLRRAVKHPFGFRRAHDDGPLYVEWVGVFPESDREPANVVVLREEVPLRLPEKVDGVYHHGPFCDCDMCSAKLPLPPRHVRLRDPGDGA
jgi:hypothetical protein